MSASNNVAGAVFLWAETGWSFFGIRHIGGHIIIVHPKTSANHRSLRQLEYYTHRCARTGKNGMSLALITSKEKWQFTQLEDKLKVRFSEFRR